MKILAVSACFLAAFTLAFTAGSPPPAPQATTGAKPAEPPPATAGFRILSDITLPKDLQWASDVRWASDRSVYLGLARDGAVEMPLDPVGAPTKEMIPGHSKLGGFWAAVHIAASSEYLAAAGPALSVTWRRLQVPTRTEEAFDFLQGIDVRDHRMAIVGARRGENGKFAPDGAIASIGSLDKRLEDLRPLLYDIKGPGAPMMSRCGAAPLGATRFLLDGSLVVVPGVQPGVDLYDSTGKLIRTWDTASLGVDASCSFAKDEDAYRVMGPAAERNRWLNRWHLVDTILPLPRGVGLVVRSAANGGSQWELKDLQLDGQTQTLAIPIEGKNAFFHLSGDSRGGKVVFLLGETVFRGAGKDVPTPPRLIVAELPLTLSK